MIVARLLPSLGAALLFVAAGAGLLALARRPLERSLAAWLGFAYLLGLAWVGVASLIGSFVFGFRLGRPFWFVLIAVPPVAAAARWFARKGSSTFAFRSRNASGWMLPAYAILALTTVGLLGEAAVMPVEDFDGRMTWGTQARYLLASGSALPPELADRLAFVIHPRYPIVLPLVQAASVSLVGATLDGYLVRPLYVLILPAFLLAVAPTLRRAGGALGAGAALILIGTAPAVLWHGEGGARGTYSDLPLAAFLGTGFCLLLDRRTARDPARGALAALLLAAAAGAKNEGLLLAPAALLLVAAVHAWRLRRRRRRDVGRRALVGLVVAGALLAVSIGNQLAWRQQIPARHDEQFFEQTRPLDVARGFATKAPSIVRQVADLSFERANWGYLFWLLPLFAATGHRAARSCRVRLAASLIAFQLAVALAAYSVGYSGVIEVTWNRLLIQVTGPLALVLAALVGATARNAYRPWRARQNAF